MLLGLVLFFVEPMVTTDNFTDQGLITDFGPNPHTKFKYCGWPQPDKVQHTDVLTSILFRTQPALHLSKFYDTYKLDLEIKLHVHPS
jgi:hypothetical protein